MKIDSSYPMWRLISLAVSILAQQKYDFANNKCLCNQPNPGPNFITNETKRSRYKKLQKDFQVLPIPKQCPQNIRNWKGVRKFLNHVEAAIQSSCAIADNCRRVGNTNNQDKLTPTSIFDYIVVGAGAAGSIVAGRLASDPGKTVLLLEAGHADPIYSRVPAFYKYFRFHNATDWMYKTIFSENYCKISRGVCQLPRGKGLGGTSMFNDMIYHRGHPYDCENWFKSEGLMFTCSDFEHYYRKFENHIDIEDNDDNFYGTAGPIPVQKLKHRHIMVDRIISAAKDNGYMYIEDMLNKNTLSGGVGIAHTFTGNGQRFTSARTYLHPNKNNLLVVLNAHVNKLLIDNFKRAYKVEYVLNENWDQLNYAEAKEEIILSAGAFNTPKILMLSGIGPKEELNRLNISVYKDLPVGQNMKSHYGFRMRYGMGYYADHNRRKWSPVGSRFVFLWENAMVYLNQNATLRKYIFADMLTHDTLKQYTETLTGPLSSNGLTQLVGMFTSNLTTNKNKPDIQVIFSGMQADCSRTNKQNLTQGIKYYYPSHEGDRVYNGSASRIMNGTPVSGKQMINVDLDVFAGRKIDAYILLLNPRSVGNVTLNSKDPKEQPIIQPNYLEDVDDVSMLVEGGKIVDSLFSAKSMKDLKMDMPVTYFRPCSKVEHFEYQKYPNYSPAGYYYSIPNRTLDDDFFTCLSEYYTVGDYHQQGTASIGKVVNENLMVKGVAGLRVVDGSVIPTTISGSPQGTIMMFAERAVDMIAEELRSAHYEIL